MLRPPDADLRALDLFERLLAFPGNERFRKRLLKHEEPNTLARLAQIEAGHAARAAMPTELPGQARNSLVRPPEQIGPFRLVQRIGHGGMGEVWRGERNDGLFEQIVAIKLIHGHLSTSALAAFDDERRVLAKLDHPDIVRLIDGGVTSEGLHYVIMDCVDGVPFDEAVQPLPLDQRLRMFRQAAVTVQFAHSRLIAHADLKPSNILVDRDGRVRLLDFGISALLSGTQSPYPRPGAMTRAYASPERLAGAQPSVADDVFALGRMLSLVVGQAGDGDLSAIIAKAASPVEASRYVTVAGLSEDIERWQTGLPVAARASTLSYIASKFIARNLPIVIAATLAIVALISTTAFATLNAQRAERERQNAAARYIDAHNIANYLMFDLMDRMTNQPRSLTLRTGMAATAQHYLDRLARLPSADRATRFDTAKGYWRLAEFQSKSGHPNLGQADAARANLKAALGITSTLSGPSVDALRAHVLLDRESIAASADNDLTLAEALLVKARPLVERAVQADPLLPQIYWHELAILRSWQGRYPEELAAARAGLRLHPKADPLQAYSLRDGLLDIYGDALYNVHRRTEALAAYAAEVALGQAAHGHWPSSQMVASRLMYARQSQGLTLNALNRLPEALSVLEQASDEARVAVAFEPNDRWTTAQQFSIETTRAQTLGFMGRMTEAMAIFRDWEDRKRRAWEANRKEIRLFRAYIQVRAMIGEAQGRAGLVAEECRDDRVTLQLYYQMQTAGALTKWDEDINLAELRKRISKNCS